jgi:hypothetical protein
MRLVASTCQSNQTDYAFDTVDRTSCGNGVLSSLLGGGSGVHRNPCRRHGLSSAFEFISRAGILPASRSSLTGCAATGMVRLLGGVA